jgi:hypothetical protein
MRTRRHLGQMEVAELSLPARSVLAAELLEHGVVWPALGRWTRFRGFGDVCTVLQGGSRVCSSGTPQQLPNWVQNAGLQNPIATTGWTPPLQANTGTGTPGQGWSPRYRPSSPGISQNLALAQAMSVYNTNPGNLSANQWSQLQAAGVIPSTLPFSSAGQLASSAAATNAAAAAAAATPSTDIGTEISDFISSVPWYVWAGGTVLVVYLMGGSGKRGR